MNSPKGGNILATASSSWNGGSQWNDMATILASNNAAAIRSSVAAVAGLAPASLEADTGYRSRVVS